MIGRWSLLSTGECPYTGQRQDPTRARAIFSLSEVVRQRIAELSTEDTSAVSSKGKVKGKK